MPSGPPPSRRILKSALLWCARWLLADGEFYAGPVRVEIVAADEGERVTVDPVKGRESGEGMVFPEGLGVEGGSGASRSELLRVLLSDDEKKILRALAENPGAKAATVQERSQVERSRFWVLWSNLQFRGFVADAARGDGYELAVAWARGLAGVEGNGERPAA